MIVLSLCITSISGGNDEAEHNSKAVHFSPSVQTHKHEIDEELKPLPKTLSDNQLETIKEFRGVLSVMLKDLNHPNASFLTKTPTKELQEKLVSQLHEEEPHLKEVLETLNHHVDKHMWARGEEKIQTKEHLSVIIQTILEDF